MSERDPQDALVQRFLLGGASEEERQDVERRLFADDDFAVLLQAHEDDLVDDYAHDRLDPEARAQFERRWLASPERRVRVEFARAARSLRPPARLRTPPVWLPTAAAALLALSTGVLGWRALQLDGRLEREQARAAGRERELEQHVAAAERVAERARAETPMALSLPAPGARDGGAIPELSVPAGARQLALVVPLDPSWRYLSYQAVIRTAEDALVWEDAGLRPEAGARLELAIPADALPAGDYILTLGGRRRSGRPSELADHYFRVVRR